MSAVGWILSTIIAGGIGWLVWVIWNNSQTLDRRLASGDMSLLTSASNQVTEVIRAPYGSRVDEVRHAVMPANSIPMVRMQLPDGRFILVPATQVSKPVSIHSPMHTSQPHQWR